ncbi:hypothetical protein [Allofournierella massiliensis]|uniref:5-bromo-4-chloroindolyl phosphate hydrolysis protein n=1 Tax=Allofournierella massiliensis TaxID=1650663 RepID=A0ABT7UT81_9FIRM|nr:hypothetical protein [Fournierella massiliensis]MDM8202098.1 hypothetical protein [Fournierella massiliensis]
MAEKRPYEYDAWGRQGQQRRGQTGSGRTPGGQDPWDEVCRSMNELGAAVATEVGRGLKEGWDQVQKSLNEAQAAGKQGQQPPQPVRSSANGAPRYKASQTHAGANRAAARVDRVVDRLGETVSNGLCMMGGTVATGCAVVLGFFGVMCLVMGFVSGPLALGIVTGVFFLVLCVAFGLGARWLFVQPGRRFRRKRYLMGMGQQTNVPLTRLSEVVQRPVPFVKKDLTLMIRKGWLPNAYLDEEEERFFLNAAEYRELQRQQEEERRAQETRRQQEEADPAGAELRATLDQGAQFLKVLGEHAAAAADEPDLQQELVRMQTQAGEILDWVEDHPNSAGKVRRLVRYYMPTTLKLLKTYDDVKDQKGEVAGNIKLEITGILHTVNRAFENLRDDLLSDTALDVSTEISAMQAMLAQDGLSADDTFYSKEQSNQ